MQEDNRRNTFLDIFLFGYTFESKIKEITSQKRHYIYIYIPYRSIIRSVTSAFLIRGVIVLYLEQAVTPCVVYFYYWTSESTVNVRISRISCLFPSISFGI